MNNKQEPPMTPQDLRDYALMSGKLSGEQLSELADWLELHMQLYREAVELLQHAYFLNEVRRQRSAALLAKVKAE